MRLTELLGEPLAARNGAPPIDPEVKGLSADSRTVRPGFLFAALAGMRLDGRQFVAQALARGAVAVLTDEAGAALMPQDAARHAVIVEDKNPRRRFALLASRFHPRRPKTIAAVTGTNGKTSVVHFTREIWARLGHPAASLGTLGVVTPAGRRPGALTTPDPVALHETLAGLAAEGIERVALEASSHGLEQFRLDGLEFAAAAFTNLTRDHLDYHRDMAAYRAAKERLFGALLAAGGTAVLNADSPEFPRLAALCRGRARRVLAYGAAPGAQLRLAAREALPEGQRLALELFGERRDVLLPLVGDFQAMNALAALGLAIATGASAAASEALASLGGVPGRVELVARRAGGGGVVVDYAHTPDALAAVLAALRPHAPGRLLVLFGCGGDRDPGKRPMMGKIAARLADAVYVTDDNPRSEAPQLIRRAILAAAPQAIEIGDRRQAIETAIRGLGAGDLLVVAGKGHETGQIVGDKTYPFDDAEIVREVVGR
ncbi:MAG TPA: UDP-N-acetylmuramoyl-L-alanyl-D-glutamate--2,6-diaminopimelate ligase [Stellaceae bacterium]|nr:UDP-N-acetylmuramoyl-L-alanyl-D-glutamate--2,6-diaminopimelate ligase [Stellaceae bacterium]